MARVTVEDCLENVDNRFQLVLLASKRARQLSKGKDAHVEIENDKHTVVALREIAEGHVTPALLDEVEEVQSEEEEQAVMEAIEEAVAAPATEAPAPVAEAPK